MALLITDVLDYLEDQGLVAGATGWTRAAGFMPPSPDKIVAVFESPGDPPEMTKAGSGETAYDEPGFQVRVRATKHDYASARAKIGAVFRALHGSSLAPATGDPVYVLVRAVQSGPLPLGLDESNRPDLTWNFTAKREREA